MNILVTGGCGFIGSNFILYWLKRYPNDFVINLDKLTYAGNPQNLSSEENNSHYKFVKGDITDDRLVDELISKVDTVVHFAAESHVDRSISGPSVFVQTNVLGTEILLEKAVKHKVKRFHHISTDEVFGALKTSDTSKFSERTNYNPRSPYSASKAGSDHLVRAFYHTYGLPTTITNCSNNFGPFQHPEKLIPLAITNLLEGKKVPVYGKGNQIRDWLYVEDHCRAIETVLQKGEAGQTYCVGGLTEDILNLEVIKLIIKLLGKSEEEIEFVKDRPGHDEKYSIDWSKIKNELGWKPLHSFEEWLKITVEWYKEHQEWWKKIKNEEWKRYYQRQYDQ
ncbi:dTDP-glucose 4,6-dehydratase [Candidatus Microgenomates bacterium]|nr:dTDP-glucose 4,6-dehydratase [Candidatus Microgenomates bacterium]